MKKLLLTLIIMFGFVGGAALAVQKECTFGGVQIHADDLDTLLLTYSMKPKNWSGSGQSRTTMLAVTDALTWAQIKGMIQSEIEANEQTSDGGGHSTTFKVKPRRQRPVQP